MQAELALTPRLVEALYVEAMVLADEARALFERGHQPPLDGVSALSWSCESLKTTTRLMHCIAWLLAQKACHAGEPGMAERRAADRALGHSPESDPFALQLFSDSARAVIEASELLYERLRRFSDDLDMPATRSIGARALLERIERRL